MRGLIFLRKEKIMSNQNGRSMIEMLGVLAIIGVLSVGGIAGYSKAMMKFKINKTIEQITTIMTNFKTLTVAQTNKEYEAINANPDLFFPEDMLFCEYDDEGNIDYCDCCKSNWGEIDFGGCNKGNCDYEGIYLGFDNLPKEVCIALATYDWSVIEGIIDISASPDSYWAFGYEGCSGSKLGENDENTPVNYDFRAAVACKKGSVVSLPMPVNIAAEACNCVNNNSCGFNVDFK